MLYKNICLVLMILLIYPFDIYTSSNTASAAAIDCLEAKKIIKKIKSKKVDPTVIINELDGLSKRCTERLSEIGAQFLIDYELEISKIEVALKEKIAKLKKEKKQQLANDLEEISLKLKEIKNSELFPENICVDGMVDFDERIHSLIYDKGDVSKISLFVKSCLNALDNSKVKNLYRKELLIKVDTALESIQKFSLEMKLFNTVDANKHKDLKKVQMRLYKLKSSLSDKVSSDRGWVDQIYNSFYIGYEGTSFKSVQAKGTTRYGFMVYHQLSNIKEENMTDFGFELMWPHIFLNLVSTSTAEQSGAADNTVKDAIELDFNVYWPWYTVKQDGGRIFTWGPIYSRGWRKFDDGGTASNNFTDKRYAGFRLAHSSEMFFDATRGTTENVTGKRYEFRGQMPLIPFYAGRIYGGLVLNTSASSDGRDENSDSLRIYVIWSASIDDLMK